MHGGGTSNSNGQSDSGDFTTVLAIFMVGAFFYGYAAMQQKNEEEKRKLNSKNYNLGPSEMDKKNAAYLEW